METLQINVKGWPDQYVNMVKKYAEEVGASLKTNGFPNIPEEDRRRLAGQGAIRPGSQKLPPELKSPPAGDSPSGVLEALLAERKSGR